MAMVDDVVLKEYLTQLTNLKVLPFSEKEIGKGIILFKIKKMVYEKDEFVTEQFISAISAMPYADCSIFLIVDVQYRIFSLLGVTVKSPISNFKTIPEEFPANE